MNGALEPCVCAVWLKARNGGVGSGFKRGSACRCCCILFLLWVPVLRDNDAMLQDGVFDGLYFV